MSGIKHIIRDIKLSEILDDELEGDSKVIVEYFNDLFSKLEFKTLDVKPGVIYMTVADDLYMEQEYKNGEPEGYLWCRYEDYWEFFESKLGLNHNQIRDLISYMVEEHLKNRLGTPIISEVKSYELMEEHLKNRLGTPTWFEVNWDKSTSKIDQGQNHPYNK